MKITKTYEEQAIRKTSRTDFCLTNGSGATEKITIVHYERDEDGACENESTIYNIIDGEEIEITDFEDFIATFTAGDDTADGTPLDADLILEELNSQIN